MSWDKLIKENFNYLTVIQKYVSGDTTQSRSDTTDKESSTNMTWKIKIDSLK